MKNLEENFNANKNYWNNVKIEGNFKKGIAEDEIKAQIDYYNAHLNFCYDTDLNTENPFIPMIQLIDGRRSVDISDLSDEDVDKIKNLINNTNDLLLLGKLYDILGVLENKNDWKQLAAENYYDYVKNNINNEDMHSVLQAIKRSLYLLLNIKDYETIKSYINNLFFDIWFINDDREILVKCRLAELIEKHRKNLLKDIVSDLENLVNEREIALSDLHLEIISILINYYKSIKSEENIDKYQNRFADICEELNAKTSPYGYEYIKRAIKILDIDKHSERINRLQFLIEESQQKLYDNMNFVSHPVSSKIVSSFEQGQKTIEERLKSFELGIQQFIFLVKEFNAVKITEINKMLENLKKAFFKNFVNEVLFDDEKKIIYESATASEEQKLEHDIAEIYRTYLPIQYGLILQPFKENLKFDDSLKEVLNDIISHNLFVPGNRREIVRPIIEDGLKGEIRNSLFGLISQFENGCRDYLKNYKKLYPIIKKGSMDVKIDLNHMIVKRGQAENKFRTAIQEILGEDLTLQIEYLSCRPLSGNLRNKSYHYGYGDTKVFTLEEVVLFFLLIKAYCKGYGDEVK